MCPFYKMGILGPLPLCRASRTARRCRGANWPLFLAVSLNVLLSCQALVGQPESQDSVLETADAVRQLSAEDADRALLVRLRGIFMGEADPQGIAFVMQDETDGIYVQASSRQVAALSRGDLIEVEGVTNPGGYAPFVAAEKVRKVGEGVIPDPIRVPIYGLNTGEMDAKWVEFTGIVRSVEPKTLDEFVQSEGAVRYVPSLSEEMAIEQAKVKLELAAGGSRVFAELFGELDPADYVDAEVRVRGLCFNLHNSNRQFVRPLVQVPKGMDLEIIRPPERNAFDSDPRPVASLLQFEKSNYRIGHRVHVRGVVLHHQLGLALWVRDGSQSLRVETSQQEQLFPGDQIDVLGFPILGNYSPILEDATFLKGPRLEPPVPVFLDSIASSRQHDLDLVSLNAELVESRHFEDRVELTFDWQGRTVEGVLHLADSVATPVGWQDGCLVRVSGICTVASDEPVPLGGLWMANSFELLLRSPSDLEVLQSAPWWNAERLAWTLLGVLLVSLAFITFVVLGSRRRLKDQEHRREMAETEFSAILDERNRVAREIHDTLSQSLGAISVHLELARPYADKLGDEVRRNLGAAHRLARGALAEARDSIWNMRLHVLEMHDLGGALSQILKQMTDGTGVTGEMKQEGASRRLPPVVENNLLRVGQEAITNACKHAKPTRIDVALRFEQRLVRLSVRDDGIGFIEAEIPSLVRRSFGLVGIRERAELLGGQVDIQSSPGNGTCVEISVSA